MKFAEHIARCCDDGAQRHFHRAYDLLETLEVEIAQQFSVVESNAVNALGLNSIEAPYRPHFEPWRLADKPFNPPTQPIHKPFAERACLGLMTKMHNADATKHERARIEEAIKKYVHDTNIAYLKVLTKTILPNLATERRSQITQELTARKTSAQENADTVKYMLDSELSTLEKVKDFLTHIEAQARGLMTAFLYVS